MDPIKCTSLPLLNKTFLLICEFLTNYCYLSSRYTLFPLHLGLNRSSSQTTAPVTSYKSNITNASIELGRPNGLLRPQNRTERAEHYVMNVQRSTINNSFAACMLCLRQQTNTTGQPTNEAHAWCNQTNSWFRRRQHFLQFKYAWAPLHSYFLQFLQRGGGKF